ncbi:MAG: hypothetical protein ACYC5X_10385 [Syntrophales bacterium]
MNVSKWLKMGFTVAVVSLCVVTIASAAGSRMGNGGGMGSGGRMGNGGGMGSYDICVGEAETITGNVVNFGWPINGLEIATANGNVTVYGIGPYWYWASKNVDMPEIGEPVTAVVSAVTVSTEKVILSLTFGSDTIQLRDTATCQPLWRGGRR